MFSRVTQNFELGIDVFRDASDRVTAAKCVQWTKDVDSDEEGQLVCQFCFAMANDVKYKGKVLEKLVRTINLANPNAHLLLALISQQHLRYRWEEISLRISIVSTVYCLVDKISTKNLPTSPYAVWGLSCSRPLWLLLAGRQLSQRNLRKGGHVLHVVFLTKSRCDKNKKRQRIFCEKDPEIIKFVWTYSR